jgi:hypothetical protein
MKKSSKRSKRPQGPQGPQSGLGSVAFAQAARVLSVEAREWGHEPPSFRSPPRIAGVRRSITRRPDGTASVAVTTRNRTVVAVLADMIEGIIVSTQAGDTGVGALRDALWASVEVQLSAHYSLGNVSIVAAS